MPSPIRGASHHTLPELDGIGVKAPPPHHPVLAQGQGQGSESLAHLGSRPGGVHHAVTLATLDTAGFVAGP